MKAETLIAAARKYLGTSFGHRGRSARRLDCWGLIRVSCDDVGILPGVDNFEYGPNPPPDLMLDTLNEEAVRKPVEQMAPGDVIVMGIGRGGFHCGLVTTTPEGAGVIHAHPGLKRVTEHLLDYGWLRRIRACYRIPGIGD